MGHGGHHGGGGFGGGGHHGGGGFGPPGHPPHMMGGGFGGHGGYRGGGGWGGGPFVHRPMYAGPMYGPTYGQGYGQGYRSQPAVCCCTIM